MISDINTEVDPKYVYDYKNSKYVPPQGKTLLIMGQTVERIDEYTKAFPNKALPGGWSAYWGVTEFEGIEDNYKNETGSSQNHQMLVDKFPNTVIQSAMWMVGRWNIVNKVYQGHYDHVLQKYAKWAKSIDRPIYLRIGYEFDGIHNQLNPFDYVKAYTYIVDYFRKNKVENIAYVWHSYASRPYKDHSLSEWYPGDDYVDWVAISVFGHAYSSDFGLYCDEVLNFAKQHHKPVMIAESNPVNGIPKDSEDVWQDWFVNFFSFIYNKNIKVVSFINENWPQLSIEGIGEWKDARLYNNKLVSRAWFQETGKEKYLKQSENLYDLLGF
jgi:beta-mannanase